MVRHLTVDSFDYDTPPQVDDREPATLVDAAVADILARAEARLVSGTSPADSGGRLV